MLGSTYRVDTNETASSELDHQHHADPNEAPATHTPSVPETLHKTTHVDAIMEEEEPEEEEEENEIQSSKPAYHDVLDGHAAVHHSPSANQTVAEGQRSQQSDNKNKGHSAAEFKVPEVLFTFCSTISLNVFVLKLYGQ
ncbi:hypothetical protein DPMN_116725 [Dreissena polymorpha]|uniref:Uncharacterized protein n=1 Tax=Dreissena polymorpha TaxID=45954 RepID=A0A9D4KPG2_DREPO|nr:hypothetical protein DPMN_116725 [Dreissena polymorpha]